MVASTPLPELSERESELLAAFLILRYDMVALAEQYKLLPQQLLAFAESPAINAHLAAFKSFAEMAFSLRSLESRTTALDTLEKVAKSSPDLIEQRRAASTILRGLCPARTPKAIREIPACRPGAGALLTPSPEQDVAPGPRDLLPVPPPPQHDSVGARCERPAPPDIVEPERAKGHHSAPVLNAGQHFPESQQRPRLGFPVETDRKRGIG